MTNTLQTTKNADPVKINTKKSRYRQYPKLTKDQQKLVQENYWIAGRLAYGAKCSTGGYTGSLTREDLESIANFAICVAATRYDSTKKVKFSTFAWRTARGYIQHALRDYSRLVKTPRWVASYKNEVDSMLMAKKTYSEIAETLGLTESKVFIVEMSSNNYHVSYDSSPEDWMSREFIYNDDDIKPYVASPPLLEEMQGLSKAEMNLLVNYVEGKDMSPKEYDWAANKFYELQAMAHGTN